MENNLDILKGLKVVGTDNNSITFDNGLVLNLHRPDIFNVVKPFNKNMIEKLNKKIITSELLNNEVLKSQICLKSITTDLCLKNELEYDDLVGLAVSLDNENDEFMTCYVHFDGGYLIENSMMFEDCDNVEEVYEHNENVISLLYFSSLSDNSDEIMSNLEIVLN